MPCARAEAIRTALVERLASTAGAGPALILHELSVGSGLPSHRSVEPRWYATRGLRYYSAPPTPYVERRTARADVALLTFDTLDLFEIKGPGDSLARLRTQVRAYDDTGSRNTLVIDERHARNAFDAVPPDWGILLACEAGTLHELRPARPNPSRNVRGLTNPLYRRELLPLVHAYRAPLGSRSDFVEFFARYCACDVDLHERWMRDRIARRNHVLARGPFGVAAGTKKQPAVEIGDCAGWRDSHVADMLERVRRQHARRQLEFALG